MPEAIKWLLLELGLVLTLIPGGIALLQWRRRRTTEQALRALAQQVKHSEAERKRTLTGILSGAHRMAEARSAEVADTLIRSERAFFRHCFNTLLSQDTHAIEQLSENLYSVLDDYLRKCADDTERTAPAESAASPPHDALDDVFAAAETALDDAVPAVPPAPETAATPPAPDVEIDWDSAFAELNDEPPTSTPATPPAETEPPPPEASSPEAKQVDLTQDVLDQRLSAAPPEAAAAAPPPESAHSEAEGGEEEDIMAVWGAALEEQTMAPTKKPSEEDAFDLGWDDAFLEETVTIKPDKKPGS